MGRPIDADALKELFSEVIGRIAIKPEMNGNLEHMIRASAMVIQMIDDAPTVQPDTTTNDSIPAETGKNDGDKTSGDCISRQAVTKFLNDWLSCLFENCHKQSASDLKMIIKDFKNLPSAQPERLTDDDFETIRIHLNAYKEKLCNQQRWEEAEEYQRIIDRFMAFASAQPETNCPEIPNNWIPCSKRHPDKEGDYLVTLWDDRGTWVEIALWNETFGGRWQAVLYNDVDYSDISNVIAWMPLPEPYQEGGEQE